MKSVYPVRYEREDTSEQDTYFIVAEDAQQAEEIAYSCIANNPPPEQGERSASYGRKIAQVWVKEYWAQPTETDMVGLIGTGSEILLAQALALYVKTHNRLH